MSEIKKEVVYNIPVCPFSHRLEILLALKGVEHNVDFTTIDITKPRPKELLEKTKGITAMPILETLDGHIVNESLVLMRYFDENYPEKKIAQTDPYRHAVEGMLEGLEGGFTFQGYSMLMNQDMDKRESFEQGMLEQFKILNDFLLQHATEGPYLFEDFGWAEAVFTPFFMRFWFLEYYEGFEIPNTEEFARVKQWVEACVSHPAAQQVSKEEIIKLYYDYAKGAGNGALPDNRSLSSFVFEPHWQDRPWPPKDKYNVSATDAELGLI